MSSLITQKLAICVTKKAITKDKFGKLEIPHTVFFTNDFAIFVPNFTAIGQISIPYKFVQRRAFRAKTKSVFFAFKDLKTFHVFAASYVINFVTTNADSQ